MIRIDKAYAAMETVQKAKPELERLRNSVQDVEAMFLKDMLTAMRKSLPKSDMGESMGGDIYKDMLDTEIARSASRRSDLGIGRTLFRALAKGILARPPAQGAPPAPKTDLTT
jgi:Rod binding domain-containing protein